MKIKVLAILLLATLSVSAQTVKIKDTRQERTAHKITSLGDISDTTSVYLRGSFNKWLVSNPFRRVSDGVYLIEDIVLYNGRDGLKVGSADWKTVNLGGESSLRLNEPYPVAIGGENIYIDGIEGTQTVRISRLTLDLNKMTLLAEKDEKLYPNISLSEVDDTEFMTDEMTFTVSFNMDVATGELFVLGPNTSRNILVAHGDKVTIGKDEAFGSTINVISVASAKDGTVLTDTIHYVKSKPTGIYVYFSNPTSWENPYCYLWSLRGDQNYPWPGEKMQWDADVEINGTKGWWKTQVSQRYSDFGEVIFNNGQSLQLDDDLSMDGTSMVYDGATWTPKP